MDDEQGTLFGDDALAPGDRTPAQLVHRNDPETSLEAAESVVDRLRELQRNVLVLFQRFGGMTQHTLIARYREVFGFRPDSSIRTRCSELVDAHLVEDSLQRALLTSGRRAVVWTITPAGVAFLSNPES